jgi:hypothetical protein
MPAEWAGWQPVPQHPVPPAQQVVPQAGLGAAQQLPARQVPAQTLPQVPQLASSEERSVQTPGLGPQGACPAGQLQTPPVQVAPVAQRVPQVPQLASSEERSVHAPGLGPQGACPAGQAQLPASQAAPAGQVVPGQAGVALQWAGSFRLSKQAAGEPPVQSVYPGRQMQAPWQTWPVTHRSPQPPQLARSLPRSTHVSASGAPQAVNPVQSQAPPLHLPRPQSWPQVPQLRGSLSLSVHCPTPAPQTSSCPAGHLQDPA